MTHRSQQPYSIDLVSLIEADLGRPRRRSARWIFWLCPFHPEKNPSFGVNPDNGSWHCFGCNKGGDAIAWVRTYHELSFEEALVRLGLKQDEIDPSQTHNPIERKEVTQPNSTWQERGKAFLQYAQAQLWKSPGAKAYLNKKRLLEDQTIQYFGLGFNPADLWDDPKRWGASSEEVKRIWLPKGYVIPCFVEHSLWYIKIRPLDGKPKYVYVHGGEPALFGTDSLRGAPLILLTEGEFDCMLTWQHLRDVAGVATLGSASKKLDLSHWMRYLLPVEEIIAVLDNDTAGKRGALGLAGLSAQIHPVRIPSLTPSGKDITDYVQAGGDLWEWLKFHLSHIENPIS